MFSGKGEEFWKAFFERTVHALWVPNEMTNSKRSEIFSGVPSGKAGHSAVALVLPNLFPDPKRVGIGDTNRFSCPIRSGRRNEKQTAGQDAAGVVSS